MRSLQYEIKGKDVPAALAGSIITIRTAENYAEAESLTKNGQSDVVAKFNDGFVIALQARLRTLSGRKDKTTGALLETAESLQKYADIYQYSVLAEGTPREVKPQTKAARASQNTGNKVFERCLTDEKFRNTMEKAGMLDGFDEWVAARNATATAK